MARPYNASKLLHLRLISYAASEKQYHYARVVSPSIEGTQSETHLHSRTLAWQTGEHVQMPQAAAAGSSQA